MTMATWPVVPSVKLLVTFFWSISLSTDDNIHEIKERNRPCFIDIWSFLNLPELDFLYLIYLTIVGKTSTVAGVVRL